MAVVAAWPLFDRRSEPTRVAVFTFEAPADNAAALGLAEGVSEDITLSLNAANVQTIADDGVEADRIERLARARELGALLVLDGAVAGEADDLRVTVSVSRSTDNVTLWSRAFDMEGASPQALRLRVSEQGADVLSCGVEALRMHGSPLDTETLSLFLRACEEWRGAPLEARDTLAKVIEREPRFEFARARMALSAAVGSGQAPVSMQESIIADARANAQRALHGNANLGEAYIALQLTEDAQNWAARERLMQQAIERDERNATVYNFYADLLHETGRLAEALAFAERSAALDPLSQPKRRNVALLLLDNGRADEARDMLAPMADYLPDSAQLWRGRLRVALWGRRFDDVSALLDAPLGEARASAALACWRNAALALRAIDNAPQTAAWLRACEGHLPPDQALLIHAALGDLDHAFALARNGAGQTTTHAAMFAPSAAPMRADPRFMPLMRDLGLLRYWRDSGHWPDFCNEPGLPYRCAAEAARLL